MQMFLNIKHPKFNELTEEKIHELNCLHFAMKGLKESFDDWNKQEGKKLPENGLNQYREACTNLEFYMQKLWGFEKNSDFHTHINYFVEN